MDSDHTIIQVVTRTTCLDVVVFDEQYRDDISDFCSAFEVTADETQGEHWFTLNREILEEVIAEYQNLNDLDSELPLLPVSAFQTWLAQKIGQEICVRFKE